jgi:hypothetical protein
MKMPNSRILERFKIDTGDKVLTVSSAWTSGRFSMKGYSNAVVMVQCGTVGGSSAVNNCDVSIMVGAATDGVSSFAVLTGATAAVGPTTSGQLRNIQGFKIFFHGTYATGTEIDIDGNKFIMSSTDETTGGKYLFMSSVSSIATKRLSTLIPAVCTYLECTNVDSASTGADYVSCRLKAGSPGARAGCTVLTTAINASSDGFGVSAIGAMGMIEFTGSDIISTNTSYTDFAVKVATTVSTSLPFSITVIRESNSYDVVNTPVKKAILGVAT